MTEAMLEDEKLSNIFGPDLMKRLHLVNYAELNGKVKLKCVNEASQKLNFSGGATSQYVACSVMAEVDRQRARQLNMDRKVEGTNAIQRLQMISKKITSGKIHLDARQSVLDINLYNELVRRKDDTDQSDLEKERKSHLAYMKLCHKADMVITKNGIKDISQWRSKVQLRAVLMPLKLSTDSKMPDDRDGLLRRYQSWKSRSRQKLSNDKVVLDAFQKWIDEENSKSKG